MTRASTALVHGLSELAAAYDVIFCDVWGVVHNGKRHFAEACAALRRFREERKGVVILVTNAPRPNPPVREQLARLAVPPEAFDDVVTSGDVTLALIAAHGAEPVYHIGPERDLTLFSILESQTGVAPPRVPLAQAKYVACTGLFDDQTEQPEDYDDQLAAMKARDLEFISANPDLVVHVGDRLIPCSGALAERYAKMGGRVLQAGKPHAPIYERAMGIARQRLGRNVEKARVLAIGDGMRTDVKGGVDFGLDVLFVAGGIHQDEARDAAAFTRFLANAESRPKAALDALRW